MSERGKEHRDRLVVLSFVSVLLVLVYGPLAPWFIAADRFLYDLFAANVRSNAAQDTVIVSIDPSRKSREAVLDEYGRLLEAMQYQQAARVVLAEPPEVGQSVRLRLRGDRMIHFNA